MTPNITLILSMAGKELVIAKKSVYRLVSVTGLESPPISADYEGYAAMDGGYITSDRVEPRSIAITFAIHNLSQTEELRRWVIAFFRPHTAGNLTVTRTGVTRTIDFILESAPTFKQDNIISDRLIVTVNLLCVQPYFTDLYDTTYEMKEAAPLLTFPLTSMSGVGATSGIKRRVTTLSINNTGDIPVGIVAEIVSKGGAVTNPYVTCNGDFVSISAVTAVNDRYVIDTRQGSKSVKKNGTAVHDFTGTSVFFSLPPGENAVTISAETGADNIESTITVRMKYAGV